MTQKAFLVKAARQNRKKMTKSEQLLWYWLRGYHIKNLGIRRQHPMAGFILDFYWPALKLGIELDGRRHNDLSVSQNDRKRDAVLRSHCIEMVHFSDADFYGNFPEIMRTLNRVFEWRMGLLDQKETWVPITGTPGK